VKGAIAVYQGLSSSFRATADETRAPMHQRLGESETQLDDMTPEVPRPFCASAMVGKLPRWHAETETDKGLEEVSSKRDVPRTQAEYGVLCTSGFGGAGATIVAS